MLHGVDGRFTCAAISTNDDELMRYLNYAMIAGIG